MKKLITTLIAIIIIPVAVSANTDLSNMTFNELVELREQINLAIWNSHEWQEVTVPPGVYEIGVDIPEGHWSIGPAEKCGPDYVIYASGIKNDGHDVDMFAGEYIMECICNPSAE